MKKYFMIDKVERSGGELSELIHFINMKVFNIDVIWIQT